MKKYDYDKARKLIEQTPNLVSASLGMHEDWWWTAETVWENGEYTRELSGDIAGIKGSGWATPCLRLETDEGEKFVSCYVGDSDGHKPDFFILGALSSPTQEGIPPLEETTQ